MQTSHVKSGISPRSFRELGLLDSPREVGPSRSLSSQELVEIESEPLYLSYTLTQLVRMSERGSARTSERDQLLDIIFMFLCFTFSTGAHSISEEVAGFYPLWFPQGKFFVSLVSCDYCCACYSLK